MTTRHTTRSRNNQARSVFGRKYQGAPGQEQLDRRRHVDEPGWYECPQCGHWVRLRSDGRLRGHTTVGLARVPCIYTGFPADHQPEEVTPDVAPSVTRPQQVRPVRASLTRLEQVRRGVEVVFGDHGVDAFFANPNWRYNDRTPLAVMADGDVDLLLDWLDTLMNLRPNPRRKG